MHIIEIDISNTKKLKAFRLKIDGKNMEVAGDTGTGKTTAISALWEILEKQSDSLSHGAKKGYIKITVGDGSKTIIAKRTNTKSKSNILLSDEDGKAVSIKDFKDMLSTLSVNPHKIIEMKAKQQIETLLQAANLGGFDLESADREIAEAEELRLDLYRKAEAIKPGEEPERAEVVAAQDLINQLEAARQANALYEEKDKLLNELRTKAVDISGRIYELEEALENLKAERADAEDRIKKGELIVAKLKAKLVNVEPIKAQLSTIEETNSKAIKYQQWKEADEKYDEIREGHAEADHRVKALREAKKEALDNATWPLEGLTIEDGDILYNGCLLTNLGESEQMLVCAALAMEDIKAHPLKVVRMDGIESMSKKDFKVLQKMFNNNGIQVLSTRVARGEIEKGEIEIVEGTYDA